tara:strand:+ start:743 stop:1009 length:267 start_codon:yes stop_codon:yes gene_type:complete
MPNIKSAIRKVKRVKKQTIVNKSRKNRYKEALKKMQKLIEKKDSKEAKKYFAKFQSELMKVAKTGIIKKKNISRKISKISKRIKNIKS